MSDLEAATAATPVRRHARQPAREFAGKHAKSAARKQKRKRRERLTVPADKRWLDWPEAESVSNLSRNSLRPYLDEIGAKRVGNRLIIDRYKLDEWLAGQPSAAEERAAPRPRSGSTGSRGSNRRRTMSEAAS